MVTVYHSPDYYCRRKPSERIMPEEDYQALTDLDYAGECRLLKIHSRAGCGSWGMDESGTLLKTVVSTVFSAQSPL
jgi:hypothetical protein